MEIMDSTPSFIPTLQRNRTIEGVKKQREEGLINSPQEFRKKVEEESERMKERK